MTTLETENLILKPADPAFADALLDYYQRNAAFLQHFEPARDRQFYTAEHQQALLRQQLAAAQAQTEYRFYLFLQNEPDALIGSTALTNVVRGCFLSCFLSYQLDAAHLRRGYATQAVRAVSRFAFQTLSLHRIEANVMPRNLPSRRVLEKCGFQEEGLSRQYLKINGVWEDHIHCVLLNPAV